MDDASRKSDSDDLSQLLSTEGEQWKWNGTVEQLRTFITKTHSLKIVKEAPKEEEDSHQFEIRTPSAFIKFWLKTKTLLIEGKESEELKKLLVEKLEISKARSSALEFMSENPSCIRAIPYKNKGPKSLTICFYMNANDEKNSDAKIAADEKFKEKYHVEHIDLPHRRPSKIFIPLPTSKKQKEKELADLTRKIEKNLHLFENRMNVTAVQASYKVTDSIEKDIPCVRVYVLGKGKIPAGETDIRNIKKKSHVFEQTEFDVAEGYHKLTTGSSLEGYALPLEGGVGIGVEGVNAAGTLGGFLEDEEGNVYILSNEHVLHPPNAGNVIVQPSRYDYENMQNEARNNINKWTNKLQKIPPAIEENNEDIRSSLVRKMQQKIQNSGNILSEIEQNPPRPIGEYVCGLKDNVEVADQKIYVDAAIAMLDKSELRIMKFHETHMEDQANCCHLYGFETDQYWQMSDYTHPNGQIIDFTTFQRYLQTEHSEVRLMKIGRTTGLTDEGFYHPPPIFWRHTSDNDYEVTLSWTYNCYHVRKRAGIFSAAGDSGSLVFDQDGRAWGLVMGEFMDSEKEFAYSAISPLFAVVEALEKMSGKKLKLWCIPNDEEPSHEL